MHRITRCIVPVSLALLAIACDDGSPAPPPESTAVRDSAGIQIIDVELPPTGAAPWATVDPSVDWIMPIPEDVPGWSSPYPVGAATLSDGRVAVADAGSFRLRFYQGDSTAFSIGGRGNGLGRFLEISAMGRSPGDTVWVADDQGGKLVLADPAGVESLEARVPMDARILGRFGAGSLLLAEDRPGDTERLGLVMDSARYLRWWPETNDTVPLGTYPMGRRLVVGTEDGGQQVIQAPLAPPRPLAVGPGRFYLGDPLAGEIRGHDPDGTLRQILRLPRLSGTLPEDLRERFQVVGTEGEVPGWADSYWALAPEVRPAFSALALDTRGNLWVGEHRIEDTTPQRWWLLSPGGALLGRVDLPEGAALLEAGSNHVLVWGGQPGIARVRRHLLVR